MPKKQKTPEEQIRDLETMEPGEMCLKAEEMRTGIIKNQPTNPRTDRMHDDLTKMLRAMSGEMMDEDDD